MPPAPDDVAAFRTAVLEVDADGVVVTADADAHRMLAGPDGRLVGLRLGALPDPDAVAVGRRVALASRTGRPVELVDAGADGSGLYVRAARHGGTTVVRVTRFAPRSRPASRPHAGQALR